MRPAGTSAAVHAHARIVARADGSGPTRLPGLVSDGPLALRRIRGEGRSAHVCLVGAMSAPLGGDRLRLDADVGPGAGLRLTTAAATVALPGRSGEAAHYDVTISAGDGAEVHWMPEPVIAAAGSSLRTATRVELAAGARLVLREEYVLGRSGERTGRLTARLTVRAGRRLILDQETAYGADAPGWDSPAVVGDHRAVGQLLLVAPEYEDKPVETRLLSTGAREGEAVLAPLAGPGALVTAVAPDARLLRRLLDGVAASPPR